jgi:DNA-binding FadR family transcriptional regulator
MPMKSAARVAREIEVDISDRGWPVGELLGSEAQLMERYGVGRGAVREAVRILEDRQLVRPREGRSGGLMITAPDIDGVAAAVRIFLWHGAVRADQLHQLWAALLTTAVGELARSIDAPGADALATRWAALVPAPRGSGTADVWTPTALHTEIVQRTGNPASVLVLRAVLDAWRPELSGAATIARVRTANTRLLSAISRGDSAAAQTVVREFFRLHSAADFGALNVSARRSADGQKLGRRTAEDLLGEIRRQNWPVNTSLGTEHGIRERLGVSRAALREAIRLLESWSVLEGRRGNGGGVFVVAPDPTALRDAARAWLDHAGTSRTAVFAARAPLEILAIRTLTESATPATIARLHDVLAEERRAGADFVTGGPDARRPSLSTEIARLSGNPALALFIPVLVDVVRAHGLRVHHPETGARWVADQHRGLVAAIEARDPDRAELLMRRYLAAVEQVAPAVHSPGGQN